MTTLIVKISNDCSVDDVRAVVRAIALIDDVQFVKLDPPQNLDKTLKAAMNEVATPHTYLGDGVYVSFDGYQFWLAANDHRNRVIALEPDVALSLFNYIKQYAPGALEP